jgi:preprotein translocase subunit SecG
MEKSGFLQQNKGAVIMKHILLGFIAVLSLMLVPLILMHKGKGGGFSNFAESLTGSAGSSGVAEKNLNRWTVVATVVWFVLIIAYGILVKLS